MFAQSLHTITPGKDEKFPKAFCRIPSPVHGHCFNVSEALQRNTKKKNPTKPIKLKYRGELIKHAQLFPSVAKTF